MLVLTRKVGEKIVIDERITITVNRVAGNRVALGIEAPHDVHVLRGELQAIAQSFVGEPPGLPDSPQAPTPPTRVQT